MKLHRVMSGLLQAFTSACTFSMVACGQTGAGGAANGDSNAHEDERNGADPGKSQSGEWKRAVFAGGCFWCMEPPFEKLDGVISVVSGYAGPDDRQPTYEEVSSGTTRFVEAVEITYDPAKVTYSKLVETFWRTIDPTQEDGQFADRGPQYRTAIFVANDEERRIAEASKKALAASGKFDKPIATQILDASNFFPAEEYHQDYYKKNAFHYKAYSVGSGRAGFLRRTWGDDE